MDDEYAGSKCCLSAPLTPPPDLAEGLASNRSAWVEVSLFFHNRDHRALDEAINSGTYLTKEQVGDLTGLKDEEVASVQSLVEGLGGYVHRLSEFKDWMHIRLPKSLAQGTVAVARTCQFLKHSQESVDEKFHGVVHLVTSALQDAGLEQLGSHMLVMEPIEGRRLKGAQPAILKEEKNRKGDSEVTHSNRATRRHLREDGRKKIANQPNFYSISGTLFPLFVANESEAVKNLGTWLSSPAFFLQCEGKDKPFLIGADTDDCLLGFDVIFDRLLGSLQSAMDPITIRFRDFSDLRKTCAEVPDICENVDGLPVKLTEQTYVYGFPLYKYVAPNALYSATGIFSLNSSSGIGIGQLDLGTSIYNYFNASAISLRDLYGVEPSLQGSPETIQASTLFVGVGDSAVNETAISQYLSALGLEPHSQLQISDFGVPNDISLCDDTDNCLETMLDIQTLQSFAPNATTYFTPTKEGDSEKAKQQLVMEFLDDLLTADPRAEVSSLSWSQDYSMSGISRQSLDDYLKKLASIGMTILVASGDAGASGDSDSCISLDSGGPLVGNIQAASWPAVSPWVTTVGGTQLLNLGRGMESVEVACSSGTNGGITSGGGFSGEWMNLSTPVWQKPFVERYLRENNASTFSGFPTAKTPGYNPQGRGFPDISAYSALFPILDLSGGLTFVSGTSLAAPLAASLFTLANEKLSSKGYKKIGYANPMLYWMADNCPEAFTDITVGNNMVGEDGTACLFGFPAAPGWDPVTGLGTINFKPFVECAMKYQDNSGSK